MAEIYTNYYPGESSQMMNSALAAATKRAEAPITNPLAYGSVPQAVPAPSPTAIGNTGEAIGAGQAAASQLPGYGESLANIGSAIKSETAGQLPPDVLYQLQQNAAERGVAMGAPGSPNVNADLLAAIGTNSLALTQQGIGNFNSVVSNLPGYGISQNPGFYPTPGQVYESGVQNSVWGSAPQPAAAAAANLAAARQGMGAGAGSVRPGNISTPSFPNIPINNPMNASSGASEGMYYGGVWYPTGVTPSVIPGAGQPGGQAGPLSNDDFQRIINQYNSTVKGDASSNDTSNPYLPYSEGDFSLDENLAATS